MHKNFGLLKYLKLNKKLTSEVQELLAYIWDDEVIPRKWTWGLIVDTNKKKGDYPVCSNTRT